MWKSGTRWRPSGALWNVWTFVKWQQENLNEYEIWVPVGSEGWGCDWTVGKHFPWNIMFFLSPVDRFNIYFFICLPLLFASTINNKNPVSSPVNNSWTSYFTPKRDYTKIQYFFARYSFTSQYPGLCMYFICFHVDVRNEYNNIRFAYNVRICCWKPTFGFMFY